MSLNSDKYEWYEKCEQIVKLSTPKNQFLKATEELSELQRAISRYLTTGDTDNLVEEMIDVSIMQVQLYLMLIDNLGYEKVQDLMSLWKQKKLKQLDEVIEKLKLAR